MSWLAIYHASKRRKGWTMRSVGVWRNHIWAVGWIGAFQFLVLALTSCWWSMQESHGQGRVQKSGIQWRQAGCWTQEREGREGVEGRIAVVEPPIPIKFSFIWWHQIAVWSGIAESWEKKRKIQKVPKSGTPGFSKVSSAFEISSPQTIHLLS
jgi:hypothetical protein